MKFCDRHLAPRRWLNPCSDSRMPPEAASRNRCRYEAISVASRFVLGVGLQHEIAHALLRARVGDRAQQREAAALTVDGVLACRER